MNEVEGYAVFFFPQALEALGDAIKPYLEEGPAGPHLMCREIDTGGALIEMTLADSDGGRALGRELMVPTSMVRMIVSARSDEAFGFGPRPAAGPARVPAAAAVPAVPAVAPELAPPLSPELAPQLAPEVAPEVAPAPATPAPASAAPPVPGDAASADAVTAAPVDPAAAAARKTPR